MELSYEDEKCVSICVGKCWDAHGMLSGLVYGADDPIEKVRARADAGDANEQYNLAFMYHQGQGIARDYGEAVRWYRLAAAQGYLSAQYNLGIIYDNGRGVAKNAAEAVRWYLLAADQGHASAQYNLGFMYANGQGVAQDDAEAVRWYLLAADQGHVRAQFSLGKMYRAGLGVTRDQSEALKWFQAAARQGDKDAERNLAGMAKKGFLPSSDAKSTKGSVGPLPKLPVSTVKPSPAPTPVKPPASSPVAPSVVRKKAGAGSAPIKPSQPDSAVSIGLGKFDDAHSSMMHRDIATYYTGYHNDEVVKGAACLSRKEYAKAFDYFDSAADSTDAAGRALLGVCYYKGYGVTQNQRKAHRLLRQAADKRDPFGMYFLAVCYLLGKGCNVNQELGIEWMQRAADAGHEDAQGIIASYEGGLLDRAKTWKRFLTKMKVVKMAFKMIRFLKP